MYTFLRSGRRWILLLYVLAFFVLNGIKAQSPRDIKALIDKASGYSIQHSDSAHKLFDSAIRVSMKHQYYEGAAIAWANKGNLRQKKGEFRESIYDSKKALFYARNLKNKKILYSIYNNLGVSYGSLGEYTADVKYLDSAINGIQKYSITPIPQSIVFTYNNLASIYIRFGQNDVALRYLNEGEAIARKEGFLGAGFCLILNSKGTILQENGNFDSALICFTEALNLGKKIDDPESIILSKISLGDFFALKRQYHIAERYLRQAKLQADIDEFIDLWITASYSLGEVFYRQKDFVKAVETIEHAIQKAKNIGFNEDILGAYETLSKSYERNHEYRKALATERIWMQMKDSMMSVEKAKAINDLELKYRTAQKDKEITESKLMIAQQNSRLLRKNTIIWGIVIGVLMLAGATWQRYQHDKKLQGQKIQGLEQERELLEQRQELNAMQSMISGEEKERKRIGRELHDGIGGLLSVVRIRFSSLKKKHQELREEEDFQEIVELLDEATAEVRKTAHNLMPETLLRAGLTEAVRIFCERVRRGNDLSIQVESYGQAMRLDPFLELSLYRIIQELVQNIIKHAEAGVAMVQFNWKEDMLTIMVEDNGRGIQNENHQGIGLENTLARVKALQGNMHIDSTPGSGTTVWLEFNTEVLERQVV